VRSLQTFPDSWMASSLLRVDLQLDVAVFQLLEHSVPAGSYFSVADYVSPHPVKLNDAIAALVYNGSLSNLEACSSARE